MNKPRCPWCGGKIDKGKDKIYFRDAAFSPAVPRFLHIANCHRCGHKYGQVPLREYVIRIGAVVLLLFVLAFIFQSVALFIVAFLPILLFSLLPFSKLDDEGKACEINTDLLCEIEVIEKYKKIKLNEIYFLNNEFDNYGPFSIASPISINKISKKGNVFSGKFLYMHEENYDYIKKDSCQIFDTEMNLVATIKFIK